MNQALLNRAIARATGETVDRIQRMGFTLVPMPPFVPRPSVPSASLSRARTGRSPSRPRWAARAAGVA
jgi:hypothetical protein